MEMLRFYIIKIKGLLSRCYESVLLFCSSGSVGETSVFSFLGSLEVPLLCLPSLPLASGSAELLTSGKWMSNFFLVPELPPLLPRLQLSDRKGHS